MTELLFVRHGEAEHNLQQSYRIGGLSLHAALTERGLRQASLLGTHLRDSGQRFAKIITSGAVRANQTTEEIIKALGNDESYTVDDRLLELSQGNFEGRLRSEVYTPEMVDYLESAGLAGALPGAESIADAQVRMMDFVDDIHDEHPEGNILVVSHGLAIRALAGRILELNKNEILALETPNTSLTRIVVRSGVPTVEFVGKTVIIE